MAMYIRYSIADAKGDTSEVEIPFPDSTDVVDLLAQVGPIAQLLNAIVTGGLVRASVTVDLDLSATGPAGFGGWGPVASLASDVQEKAEFVFRTVLGNIKRINLPTIDEDIIAINSREVDMADAGVQAFITMMEDGIGDVEPSDQRGEDLFTLVAATENWGKRRR